MVSSEFGGSGYKRAARLPGARVHGMCVGAYAAVGVSGRGDGLQVGVAGGEGANAFGPRLLPWGTMCGW